MKFLQHWMEVIDVCSINHEEFEVCAVATAYHDTLSSQLIVYRDAFLRRPSPYGPEQYSYPDWLPDADMYQGACIAERALDSAQAALSAWIAAIKARMPKIPAAPPGDGSADDAFDHELWDHLTPA